MALFLGALAIGALLVGTAALSGHPLPMIIAALAVGGLILLLARRVVIPRLLARGGPRDADPRRRY